MAPPSCGVSRRICARVVDRNRVLNWIGEPWCGALDGVWGGPRCRGCVGMWMFEFVGSGGQHHEPGQVDSVDGEHSSDSADVSGDHSRVGGVGDGWSVANATLSGERQMVSGAGSGGVVADRLLCGVGTAGRFSPRMPRRSMAAGGVGNLDGHWGHRSLVDRRPPRPALHDPQCRPRRGHRAGASLRPDHTL